MAAQDKVVIQVDVDLGSSLAQFTALKQVMDDLDKRTKRYADHLKNTNKHTQKASANYDKIEQSIKRTNDRLDQTVTNFNKVAGSTANVNKALDKHDRKMDKVDRKHRRLGNTIRGLTKVFQKFITTLGKFTIFALVGQLGLFTLGLLSIKLALITGRAAVSLYDIALKGLSVTAAGAATALSVAAAAMRQFQEAMLIPTMGGAMNKQGAQNAALLSRSLGSRSSGLLGGEASQALITAFARSGVRPSQSAGLARQMINLSGGDPAAVQQMAQAIASGDLTAATASVSGARGFKKDSLEGVSTVAELMAAIGSGRVVSDNFRGVSAGLAGTFIGTGKTEFAGLKNMFADMGQGLLGPFRDAMLDIGRIMRQNFVGMAALIQRFGGESFAPTLVTMVDKTMDFIRSNIFDHLDNITQMGESFVGFFRSIRNFFRGVGDFLGEFEPAANVLIDMFGAMRSTGGGRSLFRRFSDSIVENASAFKQFGSSVGNVIGALFDVLGAGQDSFFDRLPFFAEILDKIAFKIIPSLTRIFNAFLPLMQQLPGALDGLAVVLNVLAPIIEGLVSVVSTLIGVLSMIPVPGGDGANLGNIAMIMGGAMLFKGRNLRKANSLRASAGLPLLGGGGRFGSNTLNLARAQRGMLPQYVSGSFMNSVRTGAPMQFKSMGGVTMSGRALAMSVSSGRYLNNMAAASGASRGFGGLSALGKANVLAGIGLGGYEMFNSTTNAYKTGRMGAGGALGGASVGASIGTMIMPGIPTVVGALIGAAVGLTVEGIAAAVGNSRLKTKAKKAAADVMKQARGLSLAGAGGNAFTRTEQELSLLTAAMEAAFDPKTGEFKPDGDTRAFRDYLHFMGIDPNAVHRDEMFNELIGGDLKGELEGELNEASRFASEQISDFASMLDLETDVVGAALERLGLDIYKTLDQTGAALLILAQVLPLIERNETFLPDLSTSAMGQAELKATANAAFTTLANATGDDFTTDLISDAIQAFAVFEVASGLSPDIAGFSALREIREKLLTPGLLDPDRAGLLEEAMVTASNDMVAQMEAKYGFKPGTFAQFGGENGIVGDEPGELGDMDNFLTKQAKLRNALNLTSGLTGAARIQALKAAGVSFLPGTKDVIGKAFRNELGAAGDRFSSNASLEQLAAEVDKAGGDSTGVLLRTLGEQGMLGENDALALLRTNALDQIQISNAEILEVLRSIHNSGNDPERVGRALTVI